ncbi:FAD assembly factor SdhE [Kaarinaea lacus]
MDSKPAANSNQLSKNRLYWRCRRGMLELDYLLQNYLDRHYASFTAADMAAFQNLLDTPDALLLEYLMARTIPVDPVIRDVIQKIRAAVTN